MAEHKSGHTDKSVESDKQREREIKEREMASKGGHASQESDEARHSTPGEAREAGRKGGKTSQDKRHH